MPSHHLPSVGNSTWLSSAVVVVDQFMLMSKRKSDDPSNHAVDTLYFFTYEVKCKCRRGYLGSTLLACRAVARPHIKLEICIKSFSVE